jgi:4-hydroxymandelate oxidase
MIDKANGAPPNLVALEALARDRMDPALFDYLMRGGAAATDNAAAWSRLRLRPRVLRGVAAVNTAATVLGGRLACPILLAPTGRATRFHPSGEAETLLGAEAAGALAVLPSSVATSLKGLQAAAPGAPRWLQTYFDADRERMAETVAAARAAGCSAVVVTVDLVPGFEDPGLPPPPRATWEAQAQAAARPLYAGVGFDDLHWLAGLNLLPVVVKGVLRGDDAARCAEAGARGIVVSNHGGNQLVGAVATADALAEVVDAVAARAEIYVDGGLRSGEAILKALALGAQAVLVGRPVAWALACDGARGVSAMIDRLRLELARAMALCGAATLSEIDRSLVNL